MKVYCVVNEEPSDIDMIEGVFSTREKAEQLKAQILGDTEDEFFHIEVLEIDDPRLKFDS